MLYVRTADHGIEAIATGTSTAEAAPTATPALRLKYAESHCSEHTVADASISGLPADLVLEQVCSFLDARSLLQLAACSKRLKKVALHNQAWTAAVIALGWSEHGCAAVAQNHEYRRISQYCVARRHYQQQLPALWQAIVDQMDIVNRAALQPALKRTKVPATHTDFRGGPSRALSRDALTLATRSTQQQQQQHSPRTVLSLIKKCESYAIERYQLPLAYYLFLLHCCNGQSADYLPSGRGFLHGCRLLSLQEMTHLLQSSAGWTAADQQRRTEDSGSSSSSTTIRWLWPISDESGLTRYCLAQDGTVYRVNGSHLHDLHHQAVDFLHFLRQIRNPHWR